MGFWYNFTALMRNSLLFLLLAVCCTSCGLFKSKPKQTVASYWFKADTTHAGNNFKQSDFWHYTLQEGEGGKVEYQRIKGDNPDKVTALRNNTSGQMFYLYNFTEEKSYERVSYEKLQNPTGCPLVLMSASGFDSLRVNGNWKVNLLFKRRGVLPVTWKFRKTDTFSVYRSDNKRLSLPAVELYDEQEMQKLWVLNDPQMPVILKYGNDSIGQVYYKLERIFKEDRSFVKTKIEKGTKLNYRIINPSDEMYLITFEIEELNKDSAVLGVKGKFNGAYQHPIDTRWTFYFNKTSQPVFKAILPLASNEPEFFDSIFMIFFGKNWNPGYNNFKIKAINNATEAGEHTTDCEITPQMEFDNQAYETYDEKLQRMVLFRSYLFYGDCGYWMVESEGNWPFLLKYSDEKGTDVEFQGFAK